MSYRTLLPKGSTTEAGDVATPRASYRDTPVAALPPKTMVWLCLLIVLCIDVLFLIANVAHRLGDGAEEGALGVFAPDAWEGDHDGSHVEIWGHIQLFAASVLLVVLARVHRSMLLGAWGFALLVIVIDDLLQLHEELGEYLAETLRLPMVMGLRAVDLGELITWLLLAGVILPPLVVGYLRANAWERRQSWVFVGILVVLVIFAFGLDMAAIIVKDHVPGPAMAGLALLETFGEIIPMSLFFAFAVKLALSPGRIK